MSDRVTRHEHRKGWTGLAIFGGSVLIAAVAGGAFNPGRAPTRDWYAALEKPPFNPPDAVFAPVWTLLYVLIATAGYRVWRQEASEERSQALRWWSAQMALNAAWSPLFFGAQQPTLALADIVLMLAAITGTIRATAKQDRPAAWMLAPYLAWVSFATLLNEEIVRLNR